MKYLEFIKQYQRPLRTVLWTVLIAASFIACMTGIIPCDSNAIASYILMGMFADMGVYAAARSYEKAKGVANDVTDYLDGEEELLEE